MTRKRVIRDVFFLLLIAACVAFGVILWRDRRYNLISIGIAFLSCVPFYYAYEKKEGNTRRFVLIAVMTALSVIGRVIVFIPGFKPVTAVVILSAVYMGSEAGFLIGSLSALISNLFFGQGPWTPFQMCSWGIIGFLAGLPLVKRELRRTPSLLIFGAASGIVYSMMMDIWTVVSFEGKFQFSRYLLVIATSFPTTLEYVISNVLFLWILKKPIGQKLERIECKHAIFEREEI